MSENKLNKQLIVLDKLYQLYDEECQRFNSVCQKHCADCCTRNVTITTLEGYRIIKHFQENNQQDLIDKIKNLSNKNRFIPKITTNQMIEYYMENKELPEEENDSSWGACPLLEDDACPTYLLRPFGCRCFLSQKKCGDFGEAFQDPYLITMNTIFIQYIEYLDNKGFTGNFTDVLLYFDQEKNQLKYVNEEMDSPTNLLPNHGIKALMIPPEHQTKANALIKRIHSCF
ncbi:MAG: hypothetical protein F6K39_43925 [Okeania sp. SIO3B3]|nr:hypothetical protein [Okeania sp. SIO3B3]